MVAIGYARRSKESGARSVSLEDQRARIAAYCTERGWELAETITDDGVSGGKRERLERIAQRVRAARAGAVVCYALDRFARDAAAMLESLTAFGRRGVALHVVGRGAVDVNTATGRFVTTIEGAAAEFYRRQIGERTRHALGRLREQGRRCGEIPFGWTLGADGRSLAPLKGEQALLLAMVARRAAGLSFAAIAAELNGQGAGTKHGGRWWPESVRSVLAHARPADNHTTVVVEGAASAREHGAAVAV
jgi:site-specific DNA recombinase